MTRRRPSKVQTGRPRQSSSRTTRKRRAGAVAIPAPPVIDRLGFTCFRLMETWAPTVGEAPYHFVEVVAPRTRMAAFLGR